MKTTPVNPGPQLNLSYSSWKLKFKKRRQVRLSFTIYFKHITVRSVAISAFYLQGNSTPYCYIFEQNQSELNEEKVTKTAEKCGLKAVTSTVDFWRINDSETS